MAREGPLISVPELARQLEAQLRPVLFDVRWALSGPLGRDQYQAGHLPGAVFIDLDRDLAGPPGPEGRHPMPEVAVFQAAMRRAGVSAGRPAVVYDEADAVAAARAWWLLRYFGHEWVRVLDGGYRAWAAAGQPVTRTEPAPGEGDFTASPGNMPLLDAGDAAALARSGTLLDARAAQRYRGEHEPADPVAGHIPGAVSAPTAANVNAGGSFHGPAALGERFASLGVRPGGRVGAYCGSGVSAAHEVLALELAGIRAALYVGSWSNWIAERSRPVAVGPDPG